MSDTPDDGSATPPVFGSSTDATAVSLDADGRVSAPEAICLQCGYTIHGLPGTGTCPECGSLIADSLRGRLLRFSDRSYVQTLHRGVVFLLVGLVLAFSAQLVGGIGGAGIGIFSAFNARATAAAPIMTTAPANPTPTMNPDGTLAPAAPAAAPPAAPGVPTVEVEVVLPVDAIPGDGGDRGPDAPVELEIERAADIPVAPAPAPGATANTPAGLGGGLPTIFQTVIMVFAFLAAAFEVLVLLGWWWFSSPDPALPESERGDGPRRVIRVVVVLVAISTFLGIGLTQSSIKGFTPSLGFFGVIGFTAIAELSKIARFFATMLYLRWLSARLPDELVDRRSRLYIWLLPVIYIVGACLLIGPLVAAIMQWILLFRVMKDLKQILGDMPEPDEYGNATPAPVP